MEVPMRRLAVIAGMAALLFASPGRAADPPAKPAAAAADPALPAPDERRAALRRAIDFLDGRLEKVPDAQGTPRKPFTYAIAGLVYLCDGTTDRGHAGELARIRRYLASWVGSTQSEVRDPARLPPSHGLADSRFVVQYTWPVAAAALFFGELRARGDKGADVEPALTSAIALLEAARDENGGWGHGRIRPGGTTDAPRDTATGLSLGYPSTLVASTNVVASALGLLRGSLGGKRVAPLDATRRYYGEARLAAGNFPYDPSQRGAGVNETDVGRSAGAVFAMRCLGMPEDADMRRSTDYVLSRLDSAAEGHGSPALNVALTAFACRSLGDDALLKFRRNFEKRILAAQEKDGAFACVCRERAFGVTCDTNTPFAGMFGDGQRVYVSALHTLALLLADAKPRLLEKPDVPAPETPAPRPAKRR
jgi:hypothetical protein